MACHPEVSRTDAAQNRTGKERRVRAGRAHAALVIDQDGSAQGWCEYGSPAELPGIKHKNDHFRVPPAGRAGSAPAVHIGGSRAVAAASDYDAA